MTRPSLSQLWADGGADPITEAAAGVGRCCVLVRTSPGRDDGSPCEDGAALVQWANQACVLAVADGLGGHGDGEVASRRTLSAILDRLGQAPPTSAAIQAAVLEGIEAANLELIERPGSAGTTVLIAAIEGREMRSYHAGDSESLVVGQRGKVKFQTVSHSPVGYAVEAGVLEPEEGMEHEDRHVISNYVGMSGMRVEMTTAITLAPRDTVVLASDGLWDNLHVTEVAEIVRKGPLLNAASTLAQRCLERMRGGHPTISGKPDDLTLILYRTA